MKALIFGINGQDGFYLSQLLERARVTITGVSRSKGKYLSGNVGDTVFVTELIKKEQPDYIFHLAANSTTRHDALFENHVAISTGTLNILEAVFQHSKHSKVFLSGSGLQFVNNGTPIAETDPFEARDAYSIARIQSVYAARYFRRLGLKVYVGYFFNHDSPLRSERHVNQKVIKAVQRIAGGSSEKIEIGNMDVKKEFNHASDICEAIWTIVNQTDEFEFMLGGGVAYSIKDWIVECFSLIKITNWQQFVIPNENFSTEYNTLVSNPSRLLKTGWKPKHDMKLLAIDMMNN